MAGARGDAVAPRGPESVSDANKLGGVRRANTAQDSDRRASLLVADLRPWRAERVSQGDALGYRLWRRWGAGDGLHASADVLDLAQIVPSENVTIRPEIHSRRVHVEGADPRSSKAAVAR